MPDISVIIPCYNAQNRLADCFKSLENQTYKNFEVIFVNDGSTDKTLDVIKEFCKKGENRFFVDKKNGGVSSARNAGLAKTNGKFVYFADDDDLLAPNLMEVLNEQKGKADCLVFGSVWVKENFKYEKIKVKQGKKKQMESDKDKIMSLLYSGNLGYTLWNKMFKMDIIKQVANFPRVMNEKSSYGEDIEFNTKYLEKADNILIIDDKLYYYKRRKGSGVRSKFNENKLSVFNGLDYADGLNENIYKQAKNYIKGQRAISSLEMLLKIWHSDFRDKEKIKKLCLDYCANCKYVRKGKLYAWYLRFGIPAVKPFVKMRYFKCLK